MLIYERQLLMKDRREGRYDLLVVSVQLQPLLSMSESLAMDVNQLAGKLCTFFKTLGADKVLDTRLTEDLALVEHSKELLDVLSGISSSKRLPLLSSSCPGFVCYAEKTHGSWILPHISGVKSSQQLMGSIVKHFLAPKNKKVCHIALMPCFDKKLEASRPQFRDENTDDPDVDLVITPIEMEDILRMREFQLKEAEETSLDRLFESHDKKPRTTDLVTNHGSGSGGYALHMLRSLALERGQGDSHWSLDDVCYKHIRNVDCIEMTLDELGAKTMVANGFRNIQNIVQRMKRRKVVDSDPSFVEIMACPSGCLNGGAQIRPKEKSEAKCKVEEIHSKFQILPKRGPQDNEELKMLYEKWLDKLDSEMFNKIVFTDYKAVEKEDNGLAIKW